MIAALASEDATRAVLSGQLTRALSYSGFGEVDLSEAVARTSSGSILTVLPGQGGAGRTDLGGARGPGSPGQAEEVGAAADEQAGPDPARNGNCRCDTNVPKPWK